MIARRLVVPPAVVVVEPPRRAASRSARTATGNRRRHRQRARYAFVTRLATSVAVVTFFVVAYLALMANVTRMNYELTSNAKLEAQLAEESGRLDDQIARLESPERLAVAAAQLGMHDPQTFALVALPPPAAAAPAPRGIALLGWLR